MPIRRPSDIWNDNQVTLDVGDTLTISGNVTISDSKGFIGLVSVGGCIVAVSGNVTLDVGSLVGLRGNITLADSKGFIGLTTTIEGLPYSSPSVIVGMTSSASGGLVQFPANAVKWANVKASYANPTTCYVGGSSATINNGYPLGPGDTLGLTVSNTNQLYLVGVGTSEIRFLGGN